MLHHAGFEILDTQFTNDHLEQFSVYELAHKDYMEHLTPVLQKNCIFNFENPSEVEILEKYFADQSSRKS